MSSDTSPLTFEPHSFLNQSQWRHGHDTAGHHQHHESCEYPTYGGVAPRFTLEPLHAGFQQMRVFQQPKQAQARVDWARQNVTGFHAQSFTVGHRLFAQVAPHSGITTKFSEMLQGSTQQPDQGIKPVEQHQSNVDGMRPKVTTFDMGQDNRESHDSREPNYSQRTLPDPGRSLRRGRPMVNRLMVTWFRNRSLAHTSNGCFN